MFRAGSCIKLPTRLTDGGIGEKRRNEAMNHKMGKGSKRVKKGGAKERAKGDNADFYTRIIYYSNFDPFLSCVISPTHPTPHSPIFLSFLTIASPLSLLRTSFSPFFFSCPIPHPRAREKVTLGRVYLLHLPANSSFAYFSPPSKLA